MPHYAKPKPRPITRARKPSQHGGYADAGCITLAVALVLFFWWLAGRIVEGMR